MLLFPFLLRLLLLSQFEGAMEAILDEDLDAKQGNDKEEMENILCPYE
jgi:phosphoribosylaminoimidazole carboxylase (NCAIR synthetase)